MSSSTRTNPGFVGSADSAPTYASYYELNRIRAAQRIKVQKALQLAAWHEVRDEEAGEHDRAIEEHYSSRGDETHRFTGWYLGRFAPSPRRSPRLLLEPPSQPVIVEPPAAAAPAPEPEPGEDLLLPAPKPPPEPEPEPFPWCAVLGIISLLMIGGLIGWLFAALPKEASVAHTGSP